jgi:type I restriction enzyme S subunit
MAGSQLGDNTEIVMGQSPPGETCNTAGIGLPLLNGPTEYGPHHPSPVQFTTDARKRAGRGDILFCVRGSTTGRMNWADREYAIGRGVAAIRHKTRPELQPFVRAVVEYGLPGLLAQATGSTFPNVSAAQLAKLWWPLLTDGEQGAIAHILGTLDDKIELNRRMNETLESMARALFKSWFVDFDPVRAKAEGRDPSLPKEIADLFPARFIDTQLGEIPEGWKVGTLGNVAANPRRSMQPSQIEPSTPYIALEHMPKHCIALSDWGTAEGLESNKFAFKRGEILFGKLRPYFHKVGVAPMDGVCSTDIVVVTAKSKQWFGFVLGHVSSDQFVEYADATSTGTKMPRTSWKDMARYEIAIPPKPIATAFANQLKAVVERILSGIYESRTLAALRDALLPKLVSGELRVKDAKRLAGTAA